MRLHDDAREELTRAQRRYQALGFKTRPASLVFNVVQVAPGQIASAHSQVAHRPTVLTGRCFHHGQLTAFLVHDLQIMNLILLQRPMPASLFKCFYPFMQAPVLAPGMDARVIVKNVSNKPASLVLVMMTEELDA